MTKKRILLLGILFLLAMSGCSKTPSLIRLSAGTTGGTYYPIGGAITQMLSDNIEGYTFNSYVGNASVANCYLFETKETEMALVQSNVAYWAYKGEGIFQDKPIENIRAIASLYPEAVQIIVRRESHINSIEDLVGKKISLGQEDSGNFFDAMNLLQVYQISPKNIEIYNYSFAEAITHMEEGEIDAVFITAGYPTTSVTMMSVEMDIEILSIDSEKIRTLIEKQPYYISITIPSGTYLGVDRDTLTLGTNALWVCDESLSEELVYEMTKNLWENIEEIKASHEKGNEIILDKAISGMGIPLHEGAVLYYQEIGIFKDVNQ